MAPHPAVTQEQWLKFCPSIGRQIVLASSCPKLRGSASCIRAMSFLTPPRKINKKLPNHAIDSQCVYAKAINLNPLISEKQGAI